MQTIHSYTKRNLTLENIIAINIRVMRSKVKSINLADIYILCTTYYACTINDINGKNHMDAGAAGPLNSVRVL